MKDLTENNIYKTFIVFAIPMVFSGLLSQMYNAIDTIIAGKLLGSDGLAAIGATSALVQFISSAFWGYGTGFSIYIARLFGAREYSRIKASIFSNLLAMLAASAVITVSVLCFHEKIFDILNVDFSIRKEAFKYFAVYMSGLFIITSNMTCGYIMNAFGIGSFPFYISIISAILNIFGNIFTVAVLKIGVTGLAAATVFSASVTLICYIIKLHMCFKEMNVSKEHIKLSFRYIKSAFSSSAAVMLQQMIMYFASASISPFVNGIGSTASAAYTVILKIYDFNANIYQNSSKVLSNYTAQCMGSEKYRSIPKAVRTALIQGIVFVFPALLTCVFFTDSVTSLFFPSGDTGEAFGYVAAFSKLCLPFMLFNIVNNLFHALFRGANALNFLVTSTALGAAVRIAVSIICILKLGIYGLFIGWIASWIIECIFAVLVYISKKWQPIKMQSAQKNPGI